MQTMSISQFKANALKIIDNANKNNEVIVITKRGEPVARVVPCEAPKSSPKEPPSVLPATSIDNLADPLGEIMWDAG